MQQDFYRRFYHPTQGENFRACVDRYVNSFTNIKNQSDRDENTLVYDENISAYLDLLICYGTNGVQFALAQLDD